MTARDIILMALLWFGVGAELVCCLGIVLTKSVFDRLHIASLANIPGPLAIGAAIVLDGSSAQAAIKAVLIALTLIVASPVLTHVIARAARIREFGELKTENEKVQKS
jgi:monovalent cation/proton antiporter MnhG/PhaG subunit